jgi:hypothetical protein
MTEPFAIWHTELTEALAAARVELAEAEDAHAAALQAVRRANSEKAMLARSFAQLGNRQVAGSLAMRRRGFESGLDEATTALSRTTNQIAALRRQIQDYELALQQLDTIAPSDTDTSEAAD